MPGLGGWPHTCSSWENLNLPIILIFVPRFLRTLRADSRRCVHDYYWIHQHDNLFFIIIDLVILLYYDANYSWIPWYISAFSKSFASSTCSLSPVTHRFRTGLVCWASSFCRTDATRCEYKAILTFATCFKYQQRVWNIWNVFWTFATRFTHSQRVLDIRNAF